jgi:hypothetical protein
VRTIKMNKEYPDSLKIKKFDKILKSTKSLIKNTINEEYGYNDLNENVAEEVLEVLFGKRIFKILNEDKRGEYRIE